MITLLAMSCIPSLNSARVSDRRACSNRACTGAAVLLARRTSPAQRRRQRTTRAARMASIRRGIGRHMQQRPGNLHERSCVMSTRSPPAPRRRAFVPFGARSHILRVFNSVSTGASPRRLRTRWCEVAGCRLRVAVYRLVYRASQQQHHVVVGYPVHTVGIGGNRLPRSQGPAHRTSGIRVYRVACACGCASPRSALCSVKVWFRIGTDCILC